MADDEREALTPSDLNWWYGDQPRQRTTMAVLMLLDRRPDSQRLRRAALHAVSELPRLRQRIVDAPFHLALPRWEIDPTFDLSYHLRQYSLHVDTDTTGGLDELFRAIGPIYERPFDRTRPLWELIAIDLPGDEAALFIRLHHSVADGVGGNAILAALTDARREGMPGAEVRDVVPGTWPDPQFGQRLGRAIQDRLQDEVGRARNAIAAFAGAVREPTRVLDLMRALGSVAQDLLERRSAWPKSYGRARRLGGLSVSLDSLREARKRLGCRTIDLLLAGVAGAMGEWHRKVGHEEVETLLTAVPINLRSREDQGLNSDLGNDLTAILMHLPIRDRDPRRRLQQIRELVARKREHPAANIFPLYAGALAGLPRFLHRAASLASSATLDLIVTNVPGIPFVRYIAGAEIRAAYPIAPVMPTCPVSIALYGYRDRLYIGLDADATANMDLGSLCKLLEESFAEIFDLAAL